MASIIALFFLTLYAGVHATIAPRRRDIKLGFQCQFGDTCEKGAKCLPLHGLWACIPERDFSRDGFAGIFAECAYKPDKCTFGTKCISSVCVQEIPSPSSDPFILRPTCDVNVPSLNTCPSHKSCQGIVCHYAAAGAPCRTQWQRNPCLPGLRCVGMTENGPANVPGRCVVVKEGGRCLFGSECPNGLICTTRFKCQRSATYAPCKTSLQCPLDHACVHRRCVSGAKIGWNKVPTKGRVRACKTELDCGIFGTPTVRGTCLNGVCSPKDLGTRGRIGRCVIAGFIDNNGICELAFRGDKCKINGDCYTGMDCVGFKNKRCATIGVGRKCKTFSQCPAGVGCNNGKCVLGTQGKYCILHSQCELGLYCINRSCTTPLLAFGRN